MTVAKHRAVDRLRRENRLDLRHERLAHEFTTRQAFGERDLDHALNAIDDQVEDDVLRLMFTACHPALPIQARVALTLRLIGGLRTDEIARAFLVTEATIAQRIVRAKRTLAVKRIPFEVPAGPERAARLSSVLDVIYLVFNEGYTATAGDDWMRPDLCLEALRLGRLLAELAPGEAEVHGLAALMELQQSRFAARIGPSGEPVQLHEQNRGLWDRLLIQRGLATLLRVKQTGGPIGPYVLQAAIAACHTRAPSAEQTDRKQIAALYEGLAAVLPTPVVQLNRAVALAMAYGPRAGLALADTLTAEPALRRYHLLPAVRADLLARLGRYGEARAEFERAASLTRNLPERAVLLRRAAECEKARQRAGAAITLGEAVAAFLARPDLGADAARSYRQTLTRLCRHLGGDTDVADITAAEVAEAFASAWGTAADATWNRHRAALRSFAAWVAERDRSWVTEDIAARLDRRPEPRGRTRPIDRTRLESLWQRPDLALRERALWLLLYESAAPVERVPALNVEDLDLPGMRGRIRDRPRGDRKAGRKAGNAERWIRWQAGTARLLPELIAGRRRSPLFLADRRPGPGRMPAADDLCPHTGRGRLSYERAEYLFKRATKDIDPEGKGYTLRRLRHARLSHLGEDGWSASMLMALSGHRSVRSIAAYARRHRGTA